MLILTVSVLTAETYTSRVKIITQDTDLSDGVVVYVLAVDKQGYDLPVNRFAVLHRESTGYVTIVYDTPSGSDIIHVPSNVIDIADDAINRDFEQKYHFYRPQLWTLGIWED